MSNMMFKRNRVESTQLHVVNQNLSFTRKTILVCMFAYSLFAILDYILYRELFNEFAFIRFAIVVPYLAFLYGVSYMKFFPKVQELLLMLLYFLAGSGIVVMVYIIGGDNFYTSGLFLVFAIGFYLIRLKYRNSLISFFAVLLFFIIIESVNGSMTAKEIVVNSVFFTSFAIIGVFGGFFNDKYIQAQFKFEQKSLEEKRTLEEKITQQLIRINIQLGEINTAHEETIYSLAKLAESRDKLTSYHLSRVGKLSLVLAEKIPEDLYIKNNSNKKLILASIQLSSILHDIGKISISDEILNKPGKLTKDEFEIIKTHSTIGAETLKSISNESVDNNFVVMGIEIAKYHHEKWDGSGYPTGTKGSNIPFSARIVAIIDVYDSLISKRPYKKKFSKEKSLSIMEEGCGIHFDPDIVKIFIETARNSSDETLFWK